jgi:hypothetical protein
MKKGAILLICLLTLNYFLIDAQVPQKPETVLKSLGEFQNVRDFTISTSGEEAYISV